jgi:hypothetical protein
VVLVPGVVDVARRVIYEVGSWELDCVLLRGANTELYVRGGMLMKGRY